MKQAVARVAIVLAVSCWMVSAQQLRNRDSGTSLRVSVVVKPAATNAAATPSRPEDAEDICKRNGSIDLLVTDMVMPGMSGREVARRVTTVRPDVRVLYMSGYTTNAIFDQRVLDEGVAFLPKPFTPATLTAKVRELLDQDITGTAAAS